MKVLALVLSFLCASAIADTVRIADSTGKPLKVDSTTANGLPVAVVNRLAAEDETLNQMFISHMGSGCLISTATSTECIDDATVHDIIGFYVASTTGGTIRFYDDDDGTCSSGDMSGVITPAVGWHVFPARTSNAICVLTANTITVRVVYR